MANPVDSLTEHKIGNLTALCQYGLEPILETFGPLSIGYGFISPEVSRQIVKYQDPDKPSHHRFDLGAAVDFCAHRWVSGEFGQHIEDLWLPKSAVGSPIALAHGIDYLDIPYSRLITYSESPYVCLAVSAMEVSRGSPRKAFYENRYLGKKAGKPDYRQYATPIAKQAALETLQNKGLDHPWQGHGYPTYHGGGFRQYHHMRVSKYTMVSDWLFDLKSIANGEKNIPSLPNSDVLDAFAAAGTTYDWMIEAMKVPRMSIVSGYVSHLSKYFVRANDWRQGRIEFQVIPPEVEGFTPGEGKALAEEFAAGLALRSGMQKRDGVEFVASGEFVQVSVDVEEVLRWAE